MSLWSRNRRWNLFTAQLSVIWSAHVLSIVYISEQFTVGMTNEILSESPRTVFCSLCGLRTTEESSDRHAPGRRTCVCFMLWKGWLLLLSMGLGKGGLDASRIFFFFSFLFGRIGIVITRTMVNVKAICKMGLRPVYWNPFLTMEHCSTLRYWRSPEP